MPMGRLNPVETVVTTVGLRETIETELSSLAVQSREPSKAMPKEPTPKVLDKVVTAPAGCVGSIIYRLPGLVAPVRKILPIAATGALVPIAPVQVSSSLPSLGLILITLPVALFATQRSVPSNSTSAGKLPTFVKVRLLTV